jgi:hypothetical protein
MTNILCMDLATITGWATEIEGSRRTGFINFAPHQGEGPGWRYIRFNVWLYGWKPQEAQASKSINLVVTERAIPNMKQRAATEIAFGLSTRVEEFCARHYLRLETVHNATLKKYFTGDGRAEKEDMLEAAHKIDPKIEDHNEADAVLLLAYAKQVILRKKK